MSDTHLLQVLRPQLDDLRGKGLYKRERQIQTPQGPDIAVAGQHVINFCANNYLGLANHPAIVAAAHEGLQRYGYGMASVRFICGTQESAQATGIGRRALPRQGRRHPLQLVLGRQRRSVRDDSRRRGRHPLRRAEPRQHHRRRSPVQGATLPLSARRHGRTGKSTARGAELPAAADRDRRRLLDGRRPGEAAGHLRPGRQARRHRHGGRQPRHGHSGPGRSRAPPSSLACKSGSTSSPARWARRWAGPQAASPAPAPRSSTICGSGPGRTCSPTPCRRPSSWRR